ncbi:ExbD/TolR family protein [Taibaiella soli]|nr:biopolymer transporter ExbD [Taibaiella soli]
MADVLIPQKSGRRKAHSLRVDLTPMVDLGFLLIAFFMYTTTMAKPKSLEVNKPVPEGPNVAYPSESVVTLIPAKDHRVLYYRGELAQDKNGVSDFTEKGIRTILIQAEKEAAALPATLSPEAHKLHVIIKPADDCSYADVVSVLDEMEILQVPYYAMADVTAEETQLLTKKLQ